jgi:6-phosphofructokinase 1
VASNRCFVVEVMGRRCGYLALLAGLATGAEKVYTHEEGVRLADLQRDLEAMNEGFRHGKRLGLVLRSEGAHALYTTPFMCALFEEEGGDLFDVRQAILGHFQQGGDPSPFDRILATRFADECVSFLVEEAKSGGTAATFIGVREGQVGFTPVENLPRVMDMENERPKDEWWRALTPIADLLAQPGPDSR